MCIQTIFYSSDFAYRTSFGGYQCVLRPDVLRGCCTFNGLRNKLISVDLFIALSFTVPINFEEPSS